MNPYFLAAAVLAFVVGIVHSLLGERLIFRRMRASGLVPTSGGALLHESHVRILWATWHIATALGWGMAVMLVRLARPGSQQSAPTLGLAISGAMAASSLLVLVGTKGKHPGWAGLLGVAVLIFMGQHA